MKSLISSGYKILFFIDGNKGIENFFNTKNLYETSFKQTNLFFHQGFALLNYLYKTDILHGLVITSQNNIIKGHHLINSLEKDLSKEKFKTSVLSKIIEHLESLIQIESASQWDALLSVYKWINKEKIKAENINSLISQELYSSFSIKKDYYLLEHTTFKVYPTDKETYDRLKIEL